MTTAFGNDPAKIEKYKKFWKREKVERPLVGFTFRGWFPLNEYSATKSWLDKEVLTPDMIKPEEFMDDEEELLQEGEIIDDDIIRGDSPAAAVIPWLSGMLGSRMRILPGNILGEERHLSWSELEKVHLDFNNPWFEKYIEFTQILVERAENRFPVSQGAFRGPSDIFGLLRGTSRSILDLYQKPEKSQEFLYKAGDILKEVTEELWNHVPLFHDGYFDGMYHLWAPGPILRLQEDASALYSPKLYRQFLQPVDRKIAGGFSHTFIHLHSTSMFLLDSFLEVEEINCFEINYEESGPSLEEMIKYYKMVQQAEHPLIIRGTFTEEDLGLIREALDPRGLYLLILVKDKKEIKKLKTVLGM